MTQLSALIQAGVAVAATSVTGLLPTANGGTSLSSSGTSGNVLTSNGTTWTSATPDGGTPTLSIVSTTTQTAVKGNHYVLTNVSATTLTLPADPTAGDLLWVTPGNGLITNIMARNGNNIMGVAEDMTMNNASANYQMRYINATLGWRIM